MKLAAVFLTLAFACTTQAFYINKFITHTSNDHLGSRSGVQFRIYDSQGVSCTTRRFTGADGFNDYQDQIWVGSDLGDCPSRAMTDKVRDVYIIHDGIDDWGWSSLEVYWDNDANRCSTVGDSINGAQTLPMPCS